ncbi:MAG TPA: hypothetical protein VHS54_08310, partial [Jatrophihabitans sp.]|nr:hypothetical protein [Jatrophihabitans sp.]
MRRLRRGRLGIGFCPLRLGRRGRLGYDLLGQGRLVHGRLVHGRVGHRRVGHRRVRCGQFHGRLG